MTVTQQEKNMYGENIEVLKRDDDCSVYKISDETGECMITSFSIFDGIELAYYDIHMQSCSIDLNANSNVIQINHCNEGRIEYEFENGEFLYLSKGDLSVQKKNRGAYRSYFPLSHYHGISISIDLTSVPKCFSCMRENLFVNPQILEEKFCSNKSYTVMRENKSIEHIFSELYSVPENIRKQYFKVKVLELFLFLSSTETEVGEERRYFAKSQVNAAKQAKHFITCRLEENITISELAQMIGISPTGLKICFKGVYGDTIHNFAKNYKMQKAAQILKSTDKSVLEIAGMMGYSNASKFAQTFKGVMKCLPNEYRKTNVFSEHYLSQKSGQRL